MEMTVTTKLTLTPHNQKIGFAWKRPKNQNGNVWVNRYGTIQLYVGALNIQPKIRIGEDEYKAWIKQMKLHKTDVFYWEEEGCFVTYSDGYVAEIKNFESLIASVTISK